MVSTTKQLLITESSLASREKYNSDYRGIYFHYFQCYIQKILLLVDSSG